MERYFRTLRKGLPQMLPGYKGPDIHSRGENPEDDAFFFLDELEAIIREWTAAVYHCRPHSSLVDPGLPDLRMFPAKMFEHGMVPTAPLSTTAGAGSWTTPACFPVTAGWRPAAAPEHRQGPVGANASHAASSSNVSAACLPSLPPTTWVGSTVQSSGRRPCASPRSRPPNSHMPSSRKPSTSWPHATSTASP